jgi:hypothetical protein
MVRHLTRALLLVAFGLLAAGASLSAADEEGKAPQGEREYVLQMEGMT